MFEKERCKDLDLAWKEVLDPFELPYFHMVDCAPGNPPFDKLSRDQRVAVETEMIALIRSHALFGAAVAINENDFYEFFPAPSPMGDAYSYCCWLILAGISGWIRRNYFDGKIGYFFEAGHKYQPQANALMARIFNHPDLRHEHRYATHAFVTKEGARPIQTADILAWQHASDIKKRIAGKPRRADFSALIDGQPWEMKLVGRNELLLARQQLDSLLTGRIQITGMFGSQHFLSAT
jgi:hypothetical protein